MCVQLLPADREYRVSLLASTGVHYVRSHNHQVSWRTRECDKREL